MEKNNTEEKNKEMKTLNETELEQVTGGWWGVDPTITNDPDARSCTIKPKSDASSERRVPAGLMNNLDVKGIDPK